MLSARFSAGIECNRSELSMECGVLSGFGGSCMPKRAWMARSTCSWSLSLTCECGPRGGLEQRSFCDRMARKEIVMIELTEEQRHAIATTKEEPPTVIDPTTRA